MMNPRMRNLILAIVTISTPLASIPVEARSKKSATQATELDPGGRGAISGIGIESRDIDAMADRVVRELMSRPDFIASPQPPRIVVDTAAFYNDSSQRIDRNMITDALRASLNRAAAGRIRFISRESMMLIQQERELKRSGIADVGTRGLTDGVAGLDFRLVGRMTSLDNRDGSSGLTQRRTQVVFELVDMETGEIPWTGEPYVILRASGDDVVYR